MNKGLTGEIRLLTILLAKRVSTVMIKSEGPQDFDPQAPETFDSPYDVYRNLRAGCPVAHSQAWNGFWAFMSYEDVFQALQQSDVYITSRQNVVPKLAFTGRRPPLHLDPPHHTPYRRALNPLFRQQRMQALEPAIREHTVKLLQPLLDKGQADICEDFTSHLSIYVFAEWMNMPEHMLADLRSIARAYNFAVQNFEDEMVKETSIKLYDIAREVIRLRKEQPLDPDEDVTSALLIAKDDDGNPLPEEMILGTIRQVLVVGIIAPTVIIGSICVHLSRDRALQQQLRENPEQIPAALEEFLRLYTPYRGFARTANQTVTVGGKTIPEGEPIALVYASANRDEAVFEDAETFKLNRPNINKHLAFGLGPHRCAGMPLARMELRIALEELLTRTRGFELCGDIKVTRFPEIGALSVPLRFT
jgi:cytochrome P450